MKVFNRALWLGGEVKKVGTPTVRVLDYNDVNMVLRASGATVPTDADAGYAKGCMFTQTDGGVGSTVYINEGSSSSADFNALPGAAGGGAGTLNQAYEGGRTIEVDSGAITITDAQTGATEHTFDIDKTGTGAGDIFNIKFENAFTGRMFYLDMDDALAANSIVIDSGGTARTGADLVFTDDSTGTHIVVDVNSSGSGKSTALDWTDSYAGSNASIGVLLTMGNSNGLSSEGLKIVRGTGARTAPAINIDDDSTGNVALIDIDLATGVYTGDVINVGLAAAATTGAVLNIDLNAGVAYRAMFIDFGAGARTKDAIEVTADGSGNKGLLLVTEANTGTGPLMDIDVTGVGSGAVLDITYSAADTGDALKVVMADNVAGGALVITGAGARTDNLIDVVSAETGSVDGMVLLQTSGIFTGHMLTVHSDGAATTGGLVHLDLDAGVAYKAITIDHAGARTVETVLVTFDGTFGSGAGGTFLNADISMTGASASPFIDVDVTGVYTGHIIDVALGAASTGDVINIDMNLGLAAAAIVIDAGGGIRTDNLINITDDGTGNVDTLAITASNTGSGSVIDLDVSGARTGSIIDIAMSGVATANVILIDMDASVAATAIRIDAGAGTRTQPLMETVFDGAGTTIGGTLWDIDVTNTGAAASPLFDIDVTAVYTGNIFDVVFGNASASTGHAFHADMGTNLAGNAVLIDAAGIRTAPIIYIANTGTDGGTDDHVIFVNQTGLLDSNLIQLTFATAASTGDALSIAMGAGTVNVAGRAIYVSSAGTGVSGEGNAIDIAHTGALVAGADVVRINSSGVNSATSNVVEITASGNSTAGSYALRIDASGTGVEGLWVDTGTVLIDETLTVTGAQTLTGTTTYTTLNDGTTALAATALELNRTCDVSGRLVAAGATLSATQALHDGKIVLLDTAAGSTVTLPAASGSGMVLRFMVSVLATSNSHIIKVANANDVIQGVIMTTSTGDTPDLAQPWISAADSDTITLDRTTTGSAVTRGEWFELVDAVANVWLVKGMTHSSGTEATPFSAGV